MKIKIYWKSKFYVIYVLGKYALNMSQADEFAYTTVWHESKIHWLSLLWFIEYFDENN